MPRRQKLPASARTPTSPPQLPGAARGLGAYVIRPRDVRPSWLLLYAGALFMQLFCATFRAWVISYPILWIAFKLANEPTTYVHDLAFLAGYGPLALSVATLILPIGGWLWQEREGARSPSERERLVLEDALETLKHADPKLRPPRRWCLLRRPPAQRGRLFRHADADPRAARARLPGRRPRARARTPQQQRRSRHRSAAPPHHATPPPDAQRPAADHADRYRRPTDVAHPRTMGRLLAPAGVRSRRVRRETRARRHSRASSRPTPSTTTTRSRSSGSATQPPPRRAAHRPARPEPGRELGRRAVAPGPEPVKAAPTGPPAAGPDGPTLTEPAPSAGEHSPRQGEPCRASDDSR